MRRGVLIALVPFTNIKVLSTKQFAEISPKQKQEKTKEVDLRITYVYSAVLIQLANEMIVSEREHTNFKVSIVCYLWFFCQILSICQKAHNPSRS